MTSKAPLQTALDALDAYINQSMTRVSRQSISNLKTALRVYILPGIPDYNFSEINLSGVGFDYALSQINIEALKCLDLLKILREQAKKAVEEGKLKPNVERTTYRPPVNKWLKWLNGESWYVETTNGKSKYSPKLRYGNNLQYDNQGKTTKYSEKYSLIKNDRHSLLLKEMKDVRVFATGKFASHRQDGKMRSVTFDKHEDNIFRFLGWLVYVEKTHKPEDLTLSVLDDVSILERFIAWGINEQNNTHGWAACICQAFLIVAKWKHCHKSKKPLYRDIDIIEEIRRLDNIVNKEYKPERSANKEKKRSEKEMSFEQAIEVVNLLRDGCATKDSYSNPRSLYAIIKAWQRYIFVAILTYCPVRQCEIRELEMGRNLYHLPNGDYRVILKPDDNKTGDDRDFILSDILPQHIVEDLTEWIQYWRPKMKEATTDLESWVSFIGRRYYKNVSQYESYLENSEQKLLSLKSKNATPKMIANHHKNVKIAHRQPDLLREAQANIVNKDNLVFVSLGRNDLSGFGKQLTYHTITSTVKRAVFTSTLALKNHSHPLFKDTNPRKTNPHFFRNIGTTHERRYGDPKKRKAFHKVLGNSEQIGDRDYNEMHPTEKTVDAKDWCKTSSLKTNSAQIAEIQYLMSNLSEEAYQSFVLNLLKKQK